MIKTVKNKNKRNFLNVVNGSYEKPITDIILNDERLDS